MTDNVITKEVRLFILQYIDSVAQLEGLLMCRADPRKKWNTDMLARALYIPKSETTALLTRLTDSGFLIQNNETPVSYSYQSDSVELDALTGRVADLYRQYLVPVTNLIHTKSKTRIQEFANAFRIRKD